MFSQEYFGNLKGMRRFDIGKCFFQWNIASVIFIIENKKILFDWAKCTPMRK
jgi:hypothetical protein